MNGLLALPTDLTMEFPTGVARYITDDESLLKRLAGLAGQVGEGRRLEDGSIEINVPVGAESSACLLFGSSLAPYDQERIHVVIDGDIRTVTTLRALLSRCRYAWFLELLDTGTWSSHFQPIVRVADRITVGYEGLLRTRSADGNPVSPLFAIAAARATGRLREFDRRARTTALVSACAKVPLDSQLYINVDPGSITEEAEIDEISSIVDACGRKPQNVVIEFLESESLVDSPTVSWLRTSLREHGFRVALDDLTSGFSTLLVLEKLRPDVAKLDRGLVTGAWGDRFRRRLVQAFVDLCADLEMPLVVEGVETREDFEFARDLGVELAQGFYFGQQEKQSTTDH